MKTVIGFFTALMIAAPSFAASGDYNLRVAPVQAALGIVSLALDYKLDPYTTISPVLGIYNASTTNVGLKGYSYGVEGRYSFSGAFEDSIYVNAGLGGTNVEGNAKNPDNGETAYARANGVTYNAGAGYQWYWDNFNVNLGVFAGGSTDGKVEIKDPNGRILDEYNTLAAAGVDFKIGWVF